MSFQPFGVDMTHFKPNGNYKSEEERQFVEGLDAAHHSDDPVRIIRYGGKSIMLLSTKAPFRTQVDVLDLRFYFAPGHTKEQQAHIAILGLPTTKNARSADFIILPARPGQPGFNDVHQALLRMWHARPSGWHKGFVTDLAWIDECIAQNTFIRDAPQKWRIRLADLPVDWEETEEAENARIDARREATRKLVESGAGGGVKVDEEDDAFGDDDDEDIDADGLEAVKQADAIDKGKGQGMGKGKAKEVQQDDSLTGYD